MGINYKKRVLLRETILKNCEKCKIVFAEDCNFCKCCGSKLIPQKARVYANFGKNGVNSFTYKMPNGVTVNSKGNVTITLSNGLSYTSKMK